MKRQLFTSSCVLGLFLTTSALAENDESDKFAGDVEFGWIATSGNTETESLKAKVDIIQDLSSFKNQIVLEGLYKKDQVRYEEAGEEITEEQTTAQKYFVSFQSDLKLDSKHKGIFGFASYEDDRFSGYTYQATIAAGFSDRLIDGERGHLNYSVGPGMSFTETEDVIDENDVLIEGESSSNGILRLSFSAMYQISANSKFTQTLASDLSAQSGENSKTKSETAIHANMTNNLALKASYLVKHNTHVPDGKFHADTQTAMTLVYSF